MRKISFHFQIDFRVNVLSNVSKKWNEIFHFIEPVTPEWIPDYDDDFVQNIKWPYFFYNSVRGGFIFDLSSKSSNTIHVSYFNLNENLKILYIDIESKSIILIDDTNKYPIIYKLK